MPRRSILELLANMKTVLQCCSFVFRRFVCFVIIIVELLDILFSYIHTW